MSAGRLQPYLFRDEPTEVFAFSSRNGDPRFREVDEMTSALLRFPNDCLANFTSSFGAADESVYEVIGTKGSVRLKNAYEYAEPAQMEVLQGEKKSHRAYSQRDQFAAELVYFSDCIRKNREPEPSGIEGLIDVHVLRALYASAQTGRSVKIRQLGRRRRPNLRQEINRPPVRKPEVVRAEPG